jgi:hypothetical protein
MALWYNKIDSYRWINGSIRQDLTPDERSVWADFLALAGLTREPRRGFIERSEGIAYPKEVLLSMLNIKEELFDRTISKCASEGRLKVYPDGSMEIVHWDNYNDVSDYKTKKEAKQSSIDKAKYTKKHNQEVMESLTVAVNLLNRQLQSKRYEIRGEDILDTVTGLLVDINSLKLEPQQNNNTELSEDKSNDNQKE